MEKRGRRLSKFCIVFLETFLLVSLSFSLSFILSNSLVSGQAVVPTGTDYLSPIKISNGRAISAVFSEGQEAFMHAQTSAIYTKDGVFVGYSGADGVITQTPPPIIEGVSGGTKANFGIWKPEIAIGSTQLNFFVANLLEGVVWGGVIALGVKFLGPMLGLSEEQSNAAAIATFGAITSGKLVYGLVGPGGWLAPAQGSSILGLSPGVFSTGVGVLVGIALFVALYKTEKKKLVTFQCLPFEPPLGGENCEECNADPFRPCSEYRCRALGQACQLLNPGTAEEKCTWVSPKDVTSPTIQTWTSALKPQGLSYVPDTTIRPPNRGVKIVRGNGCLQAYTPLEFGITTNEPSQCKLDYALSKSLDEMQFFMGDSNYYRYNHTQRMRLPAPESNISQGELAPELENDGSYSLYLRCRDANGNENADAFVFNFCVDQSPDTTPPIIESTSIITNSPVRFNADTIPIEVYMNEPSDCKWSRQQKSYDDMENSMTCATESYQINANLNYVCAGNLTGIKNLEENKFYFRCRDQPNKEDKDRNTMTQSYELTLKGTQPLGILSTSPSGTIFGSTDTVVVDLGVKTDDGAEEGKSICYFSNTGEIDTFVSMFSTNNFEHEQSLDLIAGSYEFFFRCIDAGGNTAESKTSFSVSIDKQAPLVTRAYREEGLKIVTNEEAECVYSLTSCNYNFEEGVPLIYSNPSIKNNHFLEWNPNAIYYIKCSDLYMNMPSPNACSIIVNTIELAKK